MLPLLGFWTYGLFDLDEGFYAAVTAEMIQNKEWIIPTYQGQPWFEKPILLYWITKIFLVKSIFFFIASILIITLLLFFLTRWIYLNTIQSYRLKKLDFISQKEWIGVCITLFLATIIGIGLYFEVFPKEFLLRLPSFLATLGLYASTYYWIQLWTNHKTALLSTTILSTSILAITLGKMMLTDALYTLLLTNAFLSYYHTITHNIKTKILTAFYLGLAMLAKGPVAPALFIIIALISSKLIPTPKKTIWTSIICIFTFLITISIWYLPVYLSMPNTFWKEFILQQNILRFLGGDKAHRVPNFLLSTLYYFPILLIALFPWSFNIKKAFQNSSSLAIYLKVWTITIFVFFSLSQSKLPHYIFPCVPPISILLSLQMVSLNMQSKKFLFIRTFHALILFLLTQGFFNIWYYILHPQESIARQTAKDLNHLEKFVDCPVFWYAPHPLEKGPLNLSIAAHPSLSFYKMSNNFYKSLPVLEVKTLANILKVTQHRSFALIVRGTSTIELKNFLKKTKYQSFEYLFPNSKLKYLTLYLITI